LIQIDCCEECVAPKRYPGCHDECPEYKTAKAEAFEKEKLKYKDNLINGYVRASVRRMKESSNRGRGINHHAK
jgi:hypothetical protein